MTDFDHQIWNWLFPNLTWDMIFPHRLLATVFPAWAFDWNWGKILYDFGATILVLLGFWCYVQFRLAPMHIARQRGVNPALMTALTIAARTPSEVVALSAYAHLAEPDHVAEERKIGRMEQAFGNALDARAPRGFPRGPSGVLPPGNRRFRREPKFD